MNEPTEKQLNAVRHFLMGIGLGVKTFGSMRQHYKNLGASIEHWPEWAKTAEGRMTKPAKAAILYAEMAAAAEPLDVWVVIHTHKHGDDPYVTTKDLTGLDGEAVAKLLGIDFDPGPEDDPYEYLSFSQDKVVT